jgi:hypothetical protein
MPPWIINNGLNNNFMNFGGNTEQLQSLFAYNADLLSVSLDGPKHTSKKQQA